MIITLFGAHQCSDDDHCLPGFKRRFHLTAPLLRLIIAAELNTAADHRATSDA